MCVTDLKNAICFGIDASPLHRSACRLRQWLWRLTLLLLVAASLGSGLAQAGTTPGPDPTPPSDGDQTISKGGGDDGGGNGNSGGEASDPNACSAGGGGGGAGVPGGMPRYDVDILRVGLILTDKPVAYRPARGPLVDFTLTYKQINSGRGDTAADQSVGAHWSHNWLSYVSDNPDTPWTTVTLATTGGGLINLSGFDGARYAPDPSSGGQLYRIADSAGLRYEWRLKDGTVWTYGARDGASSYPRRFYLSRVADPQGNALNLGYDARLRLISLTDALGKVTTLRYKGNDSTKITTVADPFGRTVRLEYDAAGRLAAITDAIGMRSGFTYADASSTDITAMTTPYGTTKFAITQEGTHRTLTVTDPEGARERVEYVDAAPGMPFSDAGVPAGLAGFNAYLNYRSAYHFDANAMAQAEGDYTRAHHYHFAHGTNGGTSDLLESEKMPLESRVWYNYPGQGNGGWIDGTTLEQPSATARILPNGSTQMRQLRYNLQGNITQRIEPSGRLTNYFYADNGIDLLQVQRFNADNSITTLATTTYNSQHLPLTFIDAAGLKTTYTYNSFGQRTSATDSHGQTTRWAYDDQGRVLSVTRPDGVVATRYGYDAQGHVTSETDATGYTRTFAYDKLDRVTRVGYPDGSHEDYGWERLDITAYTDRAGRTTRYAYNGQRRLLSVTDALGQVTRYSYSPGGQLLGIATPDGRQQRWERDLQGRVTRYTNAQGLTQTYSYDSAARLDSLSRADSGRYSLSYDVSDRLSAITDAQGNQTRYSRNLRGLKTEEVLSDSTGTPVRRQRWAYDNVDRLLQSINAQGQATQWSYNDYSRITSVTDPLGRVTRNSYDALQRLSSITQPAPAPASAGPVIRFGYNNLDLLTQVQDPRGNATNYGYDAEGRPNLELSPDRGFVQRSYTSTGQLARSTDARGYTRIYSYDALDRLVQILVYAPSLIFNPAAYKPTATTTTTVPLGPLMRRVQYVHAPGVSRGDQPLSVTESVEDGLLRRIYQTTSYTYDALGRVLSQTQRVTATPIGTPVIFGLADNLMPAYTTRYSYDSASGLLTGVTYPSGRTVAYSYDSLGRVSQATTTAPVSQGGGQRLLVNAVAYRADGQIDSYTLGNNRKVSRRYDADGRVTGYSLGGAQATLQRDAAARITGVAFTGGAFGSPATSTLNLAYGYDDLDRLTSATGAGLVDAYAYDASGNHTQRRLGTVTETTQMQPTSNRIASVSTPSPSSWSPPGMPFMTVTATTGVPRSYSYDAMGNVLGDGKNTLRYDDLGFLTEAKTPTGNYGYLASISGLRLAKGLAQPSWGIPLEYQTFYVYDPQGRLMAEIDKAGQVQKEYLYLGTALGEAPVGVVATTQVDGQSKPTPLQLYYVMADHLGTPRLIENMSQQAVWSWKPDEPFGDSMPVQKVGNATLEFNLRFPGQYFDAETALSYNWMRYYGSNGGRYPQSDPWGLAAGINSYAYVGGNPLSGIDPSGLDVMVITGGVRDGSLNFFGHTGSAVQGYGMASYGNETPLGSSVDAYLSSQSVFRAQQVTIVPTTPGQDAAAIAFIKAHSDMDGIGKLDNCAVRTNQVLNTAGIPTNGVPFPGGLARDVQGLPGATTYRIPQGGPIPPGLAGVLGKFGP